MNIALINFGSFSNDPLEHHHRSNDCVRWWDDSIGILERGGDISYSTEWLEYHHRYWHRHNGCVRWFSWDTGTRGTYFLLTSGLSTITDPCTWLCDMILSIGILERGENISFSPVAWVPPPILVVSDGLHQL